MGAKCAVHKGPRGDGAHCPLTHSAPVYDTSLSEILQPRLSLPSLWLLLQRILCELKSQPHTDPLAGAESGWLAVGTASLGVGGALMSSTGAWEKEISHACE